LFAVFDAGIKIILHWWPVFSLISTKLRNSFRIAAAEGEARMVTVSVPHGQISGDL
jgi:hypothetical protein